MNTGRFKTLVEALEALPDHIKNNRVDMSSLQNPACGTPGCFAGLISIVANDIPELKKAYAQGDDYSYGAWAVALDEYLEHEGSYEFDTTKVEISLETWAIEYPEIWGNDKGRVIFCSVEAFGKKFKDKITHNDIIIHLRGVYERWVEFLKQK